MDTHEIDTLSAQDLAPILAACLRRLGELGREAAQALAVQTYATDVEFNEAAEWIDCIVSGDFD